MNQRQPQLIDYLLEENRVLHEQMGRLRVGLNHGQRRCLAAKGKGLGRKILAEVATIVTPNSLLSWHQRLIPQKYDGSGNCVPGRPCTAGEIEALIVRVADEHRDWDHRLIQGTMPDPGHEMARSTMGEILTRHGCDSRPPLSERCFWS